MLVNSFCSTLSDSLLHIAKVFLPVGELHLSTLPLQLSVSLDDLSSLVIPLLLKVLDLLNQGLLDLRHDVSDEVSLLALLLVVSVEITIIGAIRCVNIYLVKEKVVAGDEGTPAKERFSGFFEESQVELGYVEDLCLHHICNFIRCD